MKKIQSLGDLQLAVLQTLWELGEGTVVQVHEALKPERDLAMTTVATVLSRLEKSGLIKHYTENRQFVFQPMLSQKDLFRTIVEDWARKLLPGNKANLVAQLIDEAEISSSDVKRAKSLIAAKKKRNRE